MSGETETQPAGFRQESSPASARSFVDTVTAVTVELAAFVGTLIWTAFWLNIARLHLVADTMIGRDVTNAAFTIAVTVLPAVGLYMWHLAGRLELPRIAAHVGRQTATESTDT